MSYRLIAILLLGLSCSNKIEAQSVIRSFGTVFAANATNLSVEIPKKSFRRLPKEMYEYSVDKPTEFKKEFVELLIDTAALTPQEKALAKSKLDDSVLNRGRTFLKRDGQTNLLISPETGTINFRYNSDGKYMVVPTNELSKVVGFDIFEAKLKQFVNKAGWNDSDIEKKEDGKYRIQVMDTQRFPNHQKEPVVVERSVSYFRQLDKCAIVSDTVFEITFTRLTSGEWRVIVIHWPRFKRISSVPVVYRSSDDIKKALLANHGFWDNGNKVSPEEAIGIVVTGVRFAYFHTKESGRVQPSLMLDADLKTKDGTTDGVIFLPLVSGK